MWDDPLGACGSSKLNAAQLSMQEASFLNTSALLSMVFDRSERPGDERTAKIQAGT